jgi:dTDP-4-amino-4,6-dideoxygalactose transaminase
MRVPFLDLNAHHEPLKKEIMAAFEDVLDSSAFAGGQYVARFEAEFANYCRVSNAVGVASGTDALWFALLALGVGPGDEVITVPNTFVATVEAICFCGARPVLVDVDEETYTMDPAGLAAAITGKTRAIIPVHLFGQMADMDAIMEIASRHRLPVIEDACQAHGADYKGAAAGSIGTAGCFSFYPGKNLGALGEAGSVTTANEALARQIRLLRDHGQSRKYQHAVVGWNGRMDGIQGAVLSVKLRHLTAANEARRRNATLYSGLLRREERVVTPFQAEQRTHVFHIYAVRVKDRDAVLRDMETRGIRCGVHYPVPIHLQGAYRHLGYQRGSFPVAERCSEEFLSLPMFPELSLAQIETVVNELRACISRRTAVFGAVETCHG